MQIDLTGHHVEITTPLRDYVGGNLFADATEEDMYAAIDALTDKLDRQVKKHKEKLTDHHRSEGSIKNQI
jgi:putative sigma-54 modulation protein